MEAAKNLSVVLHAPMDIRIEPKSIEKLGSNEVLIEMKSVGICGSDVHFWQNGRIGDLIPKAPMVLGHESSGVIAKLGPGVENLKVGDRVAIEPGVPCRMCSFCKLGRYNLCPKSYILSTPPSDGSLRKCDGSLSKYLKYAADFCHKLPENVSFDEGAMMEPLSVAVHACRRATITVDDTVLILGAGPIGLLNLLVVKAMGVGKVCITDISNKRLEVAKALGADVTVLIDTDDIQYLMNKITELLGCRPNKTIECSGAEKSITLGIKVTESGGIMAIVGLGEPEVKIPLIDAAIREINLIGVIRYTNCYPTAISLVANGQVNVNPLITHHFKFQESLKAFETALSGTGIKVMITCDED